jgi:uncharacterized protein YjdB
MLTKKNRKFIATILPRNATNKKVTWISSNLKIAKVTSSGIVYSLLPGVVKITVKTVDGGYLASSTITVNQSVTGIKLNKTSGTIKIGSNIKLIANILPSNASDKRVLWKSSNQKIAKVSSNGVVTGLVKGKVTITVKTYNGRYLARAVITIV